MYDVVHSVVSSRSVFRISMLVLLAGAFLPHDAFAQQAPANQSLPQVISCVSMKGQRQVCAANTAAGVALLRSTGESSCLLGKTWGYDDAGVWVFDGCGGEFTVGSTTETSGGSDFVGTFEPYGQLRTHLAAFNDTAEVQDNATRAGINFRTRGAIKIFAGVEWGMNLVQSSTQFNLSAAPRLETLASSRLRPIKCSTRGWVLSASISGRWAGWPSGSRTPSTTMSRATRPTDSTCLAARERPRMWRVLTGDPRGPAVPIVS